jgi:predicted ferric reductase
MEEPPVGEDAHFSIRQSGSIPLTPAIVKLADGNRHSTLEGQVMNSESESESEASGSRSPQTPPGVPILEDSVWTDPGYSWDYSDDGRSGDATADVDMLALPEARKAASTAQLLQSWLRLRWRLSRRLFAVPIPLFTAEFNVKAGDLVITLPVVLALLVLTALQASTRDVKGSGLPPSIALALVFAFAVRNNSLLVLLTGISFERALFYHKLFAFVLILLTGLHGLAYVLVKNEAEGDMEHNPKAVTGMVAFIAMIVLYLFSLGCIRRRFHELFVKTHWVLFVVVLVAAVLHGGVIALVGVLPWEVDMVFRLVYRPRTYSHGKLCGSRPRSSSEDVYIAESVRASRKINTQRLGVAASDQLEVFQLPDDITCIRFPRRRQDTGEEFTYKAGQYAFLCVPILSSLEWHPFSISSSPHEELVTFHVKAVGDWTMKLLHAAPEEPNEANAPFEVLIDGPYGHLSIDMEDPTVYSHIMVFADGIGVTPMRSVVNWLHNECYYRKSRVLHRLRFIWSVSDCESLQALLDLDADRWLNNPRAPYLPDVLLYPTTLNVSSEKFFTEIYLYRGLVGSHTELDPQLRKCLWFHTQPNIEKSLREMGQQAEKNGKLRVAVLVCGSQAMATDVIATSLRLSREMNLHFDVHSEHFKL